MIHDSTDPRLLHVRYLMGFPPLTLIAPCPELTSFLATRGLALSEFRELVKDHGPWDVKHKIRALLGQGVTYCGSARCRKDVEYSVAGNILYGFVGRAGSIPEWLIGSGAGYAEASDPAHDPERAKQAGSPYVGPYDPTGKIGPQPTPFGPIQNRGDDPQDNLAVHFGIYLYDAYGSHMTYTQFLMELTRVLPQLATQPPDTGPVRPGVAKDWPYNAEYFNWP